MSAQMSTPILPYSDTFQVIQAYTPMTAPRAPIHFINEVELRSITDEELEGNALAQTLAILIAGGEFSSSNMRLVHVLKLSFSAGTLSCADAELALLVWSWLCKQEFRPTQDVIEWLQPHCTFDVELETNKWKGR